MARNNRSLQITIHPFYTKGILGYPHAGNDVFYAKGIYNNEETYAFIKVDMF